MTLNHRPAWLIAAGVSFAALVAVGGCARASTELFQSHVASRVFRVAAAEGTKTQLASAAVTPRLAFAAADVPVEEILGEGDRPLPMNGLCPADMASIDDRFCVDKYEASLVEILPDGEEQTFPYFMPVEDHVVRAVSERGVYPQGYISGRQAAAACKRSGKRLCKPTEWKTACKGPESKQYGYGSARQAGTCNDNGRSPMGFYFAAEITAGTAFASPKLMNDPQLNQLPGTLAESGAHDGCTNGYGVYDMVGNIHEWVDDPAGTFQGGYYLDVQKNGEGCGYRTDAHETWYHDYSTGFRCCADVAP